MSKRRRTAATTSKAERGDLRRKIDNTLRRGYSPGEIAEASGVSRQTVYSKINPGATTIATRSDTKRKLESGLRELNKQARQSASPPPAKKESATGRLRGRLKRGG